MILLILVICCLFYIIKNSRIKNKNDQQIIEFSQLEIETETKADTNIVNTKNRFKKKTGAKANLKKLSSD